MVRCCCFISFHSAGTIVNRDGGPPVIDDESREGRGSASTPVPRRQLAVARERRLRTGRRAHRPRDRATRAEEGEARSPALDASRRAAREQRRVVGASRQVGEGRDRPVHVGEVLRPVAGDGGSSQAHAVEAARFEDPPPSPDREVLVVDVIPDGPHVVVAARAAHARGDAQPVRRLRVIQAPDPQRRHAGLEQAPVAEPRRDHLLVARLEDRGHRSPGPVVRRRRRGGERGRRRNRDRAEESGCVGDRLPDAVAQHHVGPGPEGAREDEIGRRPDLIRDRAETENRSRSRAILTADGRRVDPQPAAVHRKGSRTALDRRAALALHRIPAARWVGVGVLAVDPVDDGGCARRRRRST